MVPKPLGIIIPFLNFSHIHCQQAKKYIYYLQNSSIKLSLNFYNTISRILVAMVPKLLGIIIPFQNCSHIHCPQAKKKREKSVTYCRIKYSYFLFYICTAKKICCKLPLPLGKPEISPLAVITTVKKQKNTFLSVWQTIMQNLNFW